MTIQDAQKNLQGLLNNCAFNGGIFKRTAEVFAMQMSLDLLVQKASENEKENTAINEQKNNEQNTTDQQ